MSTELKSIREGFGEALLREATYNDRIVALCADLIESLRLQAFVDRLPGQYVETGVAEQNMLGIAAGLALCGKIPFAASFAAFNPGRNWDQLRVSVAYSEANVKIIGSHAGIGVGADGATHQALEDIAITRAIPNLTVLVPTDYFEVQKMVSAAVRFQGPVYIRFGRDKVPLVTREDTPFAIGQAYVLKPGESVSIFATGELVYQALQAAALLDSKGISCEVVSVPTIKPMDRQTVLASVKKTGCAITVEDAQDTGGLGGAVCELTSQSCPVPVWRIGVKNRFGQSGTREELLEEYRLDADHIAAKARQLIRYASHFTRPPLT